MNGIAWVDGHIVTSNEATVPLMDRGHLLGDGLFETMRTVRGELFRRADHEDRFRHGLEVLGMDNAVVEDYNRALDELLAHVPDAFPGEAAIRVQASRGGMEDVAGLDGTPRVTAQARPIPPANPKGVSLQVAVQRKDAADPLSTIKSLSFLPYVHARREAIRYGADDALLLNMEGHVAEASTSNVFAVHGGVLYAPGPQQGALGGVTRKVVLELADHLEINEVLPLTVLQGAEEAFLTNTTGGVQPVASINGATIGDGTTGPVTHELQTQLDALLGGNA